MTVPGEIACIRNAFNGASIAYYILLALEPGRGNIICHHK